MAKNGFRILDGDLHLEEPPDLWQRYVDTPFKHLAPIGTQVGVTDLLMQHQDGRLWGQHTTVAPPRKSSFQRDQERYTRYYELGLVGAGAPGSHGHRGRGHCAAVPQPTRSCCAMPTRIL